MHARNASYIHVGGAFSQLRGAQGNVLNHAYYAYFLAYTVNLGAGSVTTLSDASGANATLNGAVTSISERADSLSVLNNYTLITNGVLYLGGGFSSLETTPAGGATVTVQRPGTAALLISDGVVTSWTAWSPPALERVQFVGAVNLGGAAAPNYRIFASGGFNIVDGDGAYSKPPPFS